MSKGERIEMWPSGEGRSSYISSSDWDEDFELIVNRFLGVLHNGGAAPVLFNREFLHQVHLVKGDEDEEFTYGALTVALAQMKQTESDWILTHEYGTMYSLRHYFAALTTHDEEGYTE